MRMKTNQLFRFRNLLLLVFISRMNIWLWRSFIRYTHAHGNLNSEKQSSQTLREGTFMLTNIFSACMCACVWCVCACVRLSFFFFIFYTKKKKRKVLKRYESTILDDLTGRNYIKVDYILMSVKDCCSWSLGVLWNDFLLSFFLSFLLSFFKLKEKYLHFPFLCKFLLDSFWEHVHFCMWATTISLLLYGQPGEFLFELSWCYCFFFLSFSSSFWFFFFS